MPPKELKLSTQSHRWHPQVVQSATCPVCESSSPQVGNPWVGVSASCPVTTSGAVRSPRNSMCRHVCQPPRCGHVFQLLQVLSGLPGTPGVVSSQRYFTCRHASQPPWCGHVFHLLHVQSGLPNTPGAVTSPRYSRCGDISQMRTAGASYYRHDALLVAQLTGSKPWKQLKALLPTRKTHTLDPCHDHWLLGKVMMHPSIQLSDASTQKANAIQHKLRRLHLSRHLTL